MTTAPGTMGEVRKQYHLRRAASGFDAWDVDRLIAATAGLPVETVPLDDIRELDRPYWFADSDEVPTVRKVVEHLGLVLEVDPSFPVILDPDGRVMDGMHRVARALLDGLPSVAAVRLPVLPPPDFSGCHPHELPS